MLSDLSLGQYMFVFVWKVSSDQIFLIFLCLYVGLMIGVPIAPLLARRLEKKVIVIMGLVMFCIAQGGLSSLRALGLFTPTGPVSA